MYIIFKDTEQSQKLIQKLVVMDPTINVDKNSVSVVVRTSNNIVGTISIIEKRMKVWKAGEPDNHLYIEFKDLVAIHDL